MTAHPTMNSMFTTSSPRCLHAPSCASVLAIPTFTHHFEAFFLIVTSLHANHIRGLRLLSGLLLPSLRVQTFRRALSRRWHHSMPIARLRAGTLYAAEVRAG